MTPARVAAVLLLAAGLAPSPVAGQGSARGPDAYRLRAVSPHPRGTAVAVALRLPAGSRDDAGGREGTAWLLGRVLEDQGSRALDTSGAALTVTVERSATVVTLVALADEWAGAWARVDSTLFDAPVDGVLLEARRGELLAHLAFEEGSPVREFEDEAVGLLADPGTPFARPVRGTPASVEAVRLADVEAYRAAFHRRDRAVQAVVGPVPPAPAPAAAAPAGPPGGLAWTTGRRRSLVRDVTSTWIAAAYPAPPGLARTRLELVAHVLGEELDPTPPDPDRYDVGVRLEETPGGPVLVVQATVFPEAADRWEARITGAVRRLAEEPIGADYFAWRRRRFRTARLLEEAAPEAEARRMTADLDRDGVVRALEPEIWDLDAAALQAAARSLGEPRILRLGPDLGQNGVGGR